MAYLLDPDKFDIVEGMAVFKAHDEFAEDGSILRSFGEARLQKIADVCNSRYAKTRDLSPFGPGHTIRTITLPDGSTKKATEEHQPPVYGYFGNYRVGDIVGEDGQKERGVLADQYTHKQINIRDEKTGDMRTVPLGKDHVNQQFPRRSVELWPKDDMIDWISVQRRTPQLDLGLAIAYAKEDRIELVPTSSKPSIYDHANKAKRKPLAAAMVDGKLFYSMDTCGMGDPMDPTLPPSADAPGDDMIQQIMSAIQAKWPLLDQMMAAFAQTQTPAAQDPMAQQSPAVPPEIQPQNPAPVPPAASPPVPGTPPMAAIKPKPAFAPVPYSREGDPVEYAKLQRKLDDMETKLAAVERREQAAHYEKEKAICSRELDRLRTQGFQFDYEDELARMTPLDQAGRKNSLARIVKYSKQGPGQNIPVGGMIDTLTPETDKPRVMDRETMEALIKKSRKGARSQEEASLNYEKLVDEWKSGKINGVAVG